MKTYTITLDQDGRLTTPHEIRLSQNEHGNTQLIFLLPTEFIGTNVHLEYYNRHAPADQIRTEPLPLSGNKAAFIVTPSFTFAVGNVVMQLVGEKDGTIIKSQIKGSAEIKILPSINATAFETAQITTFDPYKVLNRLSNLETQLDETAESSKIWNALTCTNAKVAQKADKIEVAAAMSDLHTTFNTINTALTSELNLKADKSETASSLNDLSNSLGDMHNTVSGINSTLAKKAEKTDVTSSLALKADKTQISTLSQAIATKADDNTVLHRNLLWEGSLYIDHKAATVSLDNTNYEYLELHFETGICYLRRTSALIGVIIGSSNEQYETTIRTIKTQITGNTIKFSDSRFIVISEYVFEISDFNTRLYKVVGLY